MSREVSSAVSARYGVGCPTCAAGPGEACRTLRTNRVTDTHAARIHRDDVTAGRLVHHCTSCRNFAGMVSERCCTCCTDRNGDRPGRGASIANEEAR